MADVGDHLHQNGPCKYKLSDLYYEPPVTTAVEKIAPLPMTKVNGMEKMEKNR